MSVANDKAFTPLEFSSQISQMADHSSETPVIHDGVVMIPRLVSTLQSSAL